MQQLTYSVIFLRLYFLHLQNEANSMIFAGLFVEYISNASEEFSPGPGI